MRLITVFLFVVEAKEAAQAAAAAAAKGIHSLSLK